MPIPQPVPVRSEMLAEHDLLRGRERAEMAFVDFFRFDV